MRYFIERAGERHGPYSVGDLRAYVRAGHVAPNDLATPEDGSEPVEVDVLLRSSGPPPTPTAVTSPQTIGARGTEAAPSVPQIPRPAPAEVMASGGKGKWAAALVLAAIGIYFLTSRDGDDRDPSPTTRSDDPPVPITPVIDLSEKPLLADREGHAPRWKESSYESDGAAVRPPSSLLHLVKYSSPAGELAAYVSPDPGDGQKHPVIVWAKGGFGGIGRFLWRSAPKDNDQSVRAFLDAGVIVVCPSWRGENDNPGKFELFYGEVEDILAAIDYAKALPYVDPSRVYLAGHSTGGTMTLLAAAAGADVRAAFSFGGEVDLEETIDTYDNSPYPPASARDNKLRSAIRYTSFIQSPTFYFEGADHFDDRVRVMEELARSKGVPFDAFTLPGDHWNILRPTTTLVAQKILADTGAQASIKFSREELRKAFEDTHSKTLARELATWAKGGGSLKEVLDGLGSADQIPANETDVRAMKVIISALANGTPTPAKVRDLATLAALGERIDDGGAEEAFDSSVIPELVDWVGRNFRKGSSVPEDAYPDALKVLRAVAWNGSEESAAVVAKAATSGFAGDHGGWGSVFSAIYTDDDAFPILMGKLSKSPPGGRVGGSIANRVNLAYFNDEWEGTHPYDNPKGAERLSEWLTHPVGGEERDPSAFAAAVALGFVSKPTRSAELLEKALNHPDKDIALEAGWADLKTGGDGKGLELLKKTCHNPIWSETAKSYLRELEREDAIPEAANEPDFTATATMINWLKHPNELGAPPKRIDILDKRRLFWPPLDKRVPVWLFEFDHPGGEDGETTTSYGMVGGVTWSTFDQYQNPPTPAELYLIHCRAEMRRNGEISAEAVREILAEKNADLFR